MDDKKFYYIIGSLSIGIALMGEGFDNYDKEKFNSGFIYCTKQLDYLIALKKNKKI